MPFKAVHTLAIEGEVYREGQLIKPNVNPKTVEQLLLAHSLEEVPDTDSEVKPKIAEPEPETEAKPVEKKAKKTKPQREDEDNE